MRHSRRAVSRDTRVLFVIVVASIGMLWALARLRFPDRVQPVAPVLAQLGPASAFDDMATTVARVADRVESLVVSVPSHPENGAASRSALRFRDDLAVLLIGGSSLAQKPAPALVGTLEIARDRAARLAVIRLLPPADAPTLSTWAPRRLSTPRFLFAARATPTGVSVQPVFMASMRAIVTPIWLDPIWELDGADAAPGTFMFTMDGALAGLVIERDGRPALVPADTVLARAERLVSEGQSRPGVLGVEIGSLSRSVATATGADAGVAVTWVDPQGPAAQSLQIADVVQSIDGSPATTIEHWVARVARLSEGESVDLKVQRASGIHDVRLTAAAPRVADPTPRRGIGLTLQTISGIGAAIARVDPDSPASLAGLTTGDVITLVGDVHSPTAAQASLAFSTASDERPLVVAFEREHSHHLIALERTW